MRPRVVDGVNDMSLSTISENQYADAPPPLFLLLLNVCAARPATKNFNDEECYHVRRHQG